MYLIREKEIKDCERTLFITNKSWNDTYIGLINHDFLDSLWENHDERLQREIDDFKNTDIYRFVLEIDNEIVGFITCGKSRLEDKKYQGEIYALYILKEYQNKGYGKKLLEKAINKLKEVGYKEIIVGCLDGNESNDFYIHQKAVFKESGMFQIKDLIFKQNYYIWK